MRIDRKGDIGFPEAIMAVMIVVLMLTGYMALVAGDILNNETKTSELDCGIFDNLTITDGKIDDISEQLISYAEVEGILGIKIQYEIPGGLASANDLEYGSFDGNVRTDRILLNVNSCNGSTIAVIVKVVTCA